MKAPGVIGLAVLGCGLVVGCRWSDPYPWQPGYAYPPAVTYPPSMTYPPAAYGTVVDPNCAPVTSGAALPATPATTSALPGPSGSLRTLEPVQPAPR